MLMRANIVRGLFYFVGGNFLGPMRLFWRVVLELGISLILVSVAILGLK